MEAQTRAYQGAEQRAGAQIDPSVFQNMMGGMIEPMRGSWGREVGRSRERTLSGLGGVLGTSPELASRMALRGEQTGMQQWGDMMNQLASQQQQMMGQAYLQQPYRFGGGGGLGGIGQGGGGFLRTMG